MTGDTFRLILACLMVGGFFLVMLGISGVMISSVFASPGCEIAGGYNHTDPSKSTGWAKECITQMEAGIYADSVRTASLGIMIAMAAAALGGALAVVQIIRVMRGRSGR